jgi:hypothetical protein
VGFFANLFQARPKPAIEVEAGLSYRVINPFTVEVLIAPKWLDYDGNAEDMGKPKRDELTFIKKLNAVAECRTQSEASAVARVLECMDHFCENCGEQVYEWDKKCDECNKPLWKGSKKMEMVVVHVP